MATRTEQLSTQAVVTDEVRTSSASSGKVKRFVNRALVYLVLIAVSIVMVAPFYFLISGSLDGPG